ncbi:tetratricopeptide repeat protein [Kribbella sp. HUAS MG21]|jgi:tetratricopeptide (TPR) repeat protein|uniref:Tetratricopeptide repeat protein n=1 Tax=Kribbella sp. HUAS MG21 TaxID=3160966 RepID=A0AAU7T718_9ACTN
MSHVAATDLVDAAVQLMRAGQWTAATDLLTAAHTDDPAERRTLALALAEVAVDQDFAQQTDHASAALAVAEQLSDDSSTWDLELLKLRKDYGTALFGSPTGAAGLADRARRLIAQAPDDRRRGTVSFWAGVMADNLLNRPDEAFAHYTTALELGEKTDDKLLTSYALRHLGDHAHTAGDLALARQHWERSTELRQQVGHLLGALAQQTLLAVLLRDEGDLAGARALATEVNRWARQVPIPSLVQQTGDLMTLSC